MHYCAMIKWIFVASAAIFSLCVVDALKVQISGDVETMTENDILHAEKAQNELNKVETNPAALKKQSKKLDPANCHLRVLLARTKAGKEPHWETAQQAKVGSNGKYKFDFEVSDPDNVGTQYTWGVAADSRIFELQTLSNEPMTLRVLKNTTKQIHIFIDIYANTLHTAINDVVAGSNLGLVKLVDPTMTKELQSQYGQTKQIDAELPLEEEPKHHITEQDRYIEIAQHLGDVWSKLLLARVLSDNADFSGDCTTAAEKVQELADEITNHHDMNHGHMKEKAKSALTKIESLKTIYPNLTSDWHHKPSDSRITKYVKEMIENSHEILKKMDELPGPKDGGH